MLSIRNNPSGTARPPNALLDVEQAALLLGLGRRTLENWRCRGEGPPFLKIGRTVRYAPSDLAHWLESRRCHNTGQAQVTNGAE